MKSLFGTLNALLIVLLIVVVAAAASFATYRWQHNKVNGLNGQVSNLNSQVKSLDNQISILSSQDNKTCSQNQQPGTNPVCEGYRYTSPKGVSVLLFAPSRNGTITSPVAVLGEVPGNWSFEAQFPVQLKNSKGYVVAQAPAHMLGNWQTTSLVPFSAQLTYSATQSGSGTIVLKKDNPSGLPSNEDSVTVPVNF